MSSSSNNVVPVPEEAAEALAWGTSPVLYLSYGMVAMKGMRPASALTDAVEAAPSFTVLSPPMGLDLFGVLDGRGLGAAAAAGEPERLLALLRDAVAGQVYKELCSDSPRFLDETSRDDDVVVGWWATTLREAFRAFHEEVAAAACRSQGQTGVATAGTTALVALVLERYLVIGNSGASKAVLSRDGELVELTGSDSEHTVIIRRPAAAPGAAGVVDVGAVAREARDEFLILGSAALWDKVTPAAACAHVRRRLGRTSRVTMPWETRITDTDISVEGLPRTLRMLAGELAKKAVHAGSRDNVSVVLVVFRDFWAQGSAGLINV